MKKFFKYITSRIVVLILILILLDVVYTVVYVHKKGIRNKVEYVFQKSNENYDYIFLGSSRVEYHIDTDYINEESQVKSLNLGISGQNLTETLLLLKLLINKNITAQKYFIQLDESDLSFIEGKSFLGASYFMPYVSNKNVNEHLKKYDADFNLDSKIPFYRYMNYGYKIGYRDLLLKLTNKVRKEPFFIGLKTDLKNNEGSYIFKENYTNELLGEIQTFAKSNNLNIIFFTSPYYNPKNTSKYKNFAKQNNIVDYIDSITNVKYFKDVNHLNSKGARMFTEMLIRDFKLKN